MLTRSIYPTQDELREITKEYVSENHSDYFKGFNKKCWIAHYEKNIYKPVRLCILIQKLIVFYIILLNIII
jgi:hypothetical protein